MLDLYKTNGSSPPRCGGTNGIRCWRATLRARRRVDHWCEDRHRHLGACVCAGCGTIIATRPMMPTPGELFDHPARRAERAAMDAAARRAANDEIRAWLSWFAVRVVVLGALGVTCVGIDGRVATVMLAMVAVIFACCWWLTRSEP